ncbi:hypothetical protein B296_00026695 [Ensete ventricosum]|uniref:Uncharacterized protein n=1 Tax=Ensete ventricosum TaxID=4639 RepID=A0A426XPL1_ENSVE|nr:hypothetical protein B296_00026695 [Ensete ventricosum]
MHPLRFPNTSIRAKVFVRKIGFKLREMRLNHVELFYVFLLHFRSESSKERGWPTMSRPSAKVADHGQATYRGGRPRPAPLQGQPVAVAAASKSRRKGGRPLAGRLLVTRGRRHQRRGDSGGAVKAKSARASFYRKIIMHLRI